MQYDISESLKIYKTEEIEFSNKLKQLFGHNANVSFSTKEQDMKEHWDVKLEFINQSFISPKFFNLKTVTFDVKAVKKTNRNDINTNDDIHWIEMLNVAGYNGWVSAKANYIAFKTNTHWILVDREKLKQYTLEKCGNPIESNILNMPTSNRNFYTYYRRYGRKDAVALFKTIDLENIMFKKFIL
jgi:hypothetical protein